MGEISDGGIVGVKSIQGKSTRRHRWQVNRDFGRPTLSLWEAFKSSISLQNRSSLVMGQELGEVKEILDHPWFKRVWIMQGQHVLILDCYLS
jgi:hypothetical protein